MMQPYTDTRETTSEDCVRGKRTGTRGRRRERGGERWWFPQRIGGKGARNSADREGEIGDRVANAGRVAAPLGGANGTILSGELENGETRVHPHARIAEGEEEREGEAEGESEVGEIGATNKPRAIGSPRHSRSPAADVWPGFVYISAIEFSPGCAHASIR